MKKNGKSIIKWLNNDPANYIIISFLILLVPFIILGIIFPAGEGINEGIFGTKTGRIITTTSIVASTFGMLNITLYSKINHNNEKQKQILKWFFLTFNSISVIALMISDLAGQRYINVFVDFWFLITMFLQFFLWFGKPKENLEELEINKQNKKSEVFGAILINDFIKYFILMILIGMLLSIFEHLVVWNLTNIGENTSSNTADQNITWLWTTIDGITASSAIIAGFLLAYKKYDSLIFYFIGDVINMIYFSIGFYFRFGQVNWPLMALFTFYTISNIVNYINWKYVMPKRNQQNILNIIVEI